MLDNWHYYTDIKPTNFIIDNDNDKIYFININNLQIHKMKSKRVANNNYINGFKSIKDTHRYDLECYKRTITSLFWTIYFFYNCSENNSLDTNNKLYPYINNFEIIFHKEPHIAEDNVKQIKRLFDIIRDLVI